jgi:hypothetical protein
MKSTALQMQIRCKHAGRCIVLTFMQMLTCRFDKMKFFSRRTVASIRHPTCPMLFNLRSSDLRDVLLSRPVTMDLVPLSPAPFLHQGVCQRSKGVSK